MPRPLPLVVRFSSHVDQPSGPDACHPWTGYVSPSGYGAVIVGSRADGSRRVERAHRVAYELEYGPVPDGHSVDHTCHNRAAERGECGGGPTCLHRRCCNAQHLVLRATNGENGVASPLTLTGKRARQTHCKRGHPLSGSNLALYGGGRRCRQCIRDANRERQRRYRAR